MSRASLTRAGSMLAAFVIMSAFSERTAGAQAWVDTPGSLAASLEYVFAPSTAIVNDPDEEFDNEDITAHTVSVGLEYTPIEDLGLDLTVPMVATKYGGEGTSFPPHGDYDDGDLHTTLQDLRLNARYQLLHEIVAFAPHIGGSIPLSDYETIGFANAGRGLKQLHVGASIGRTLDPVLPNLFVHATYEFSLVERFDDTNGDEAAAEMTKDIGQNRSDVSFLLGYFFLDGDLSLDVGLNWRIHHGGIDFSELGAPGGPMYVYHDPLLNEEFMLVGGDVTYNITDRISVNGTTRFFLRGYNTRDANLFGLGLSFAIL
ncbi:MAG TPA: hypothetical protein VNO33_12690 [Kofleriaceae bacterium]|nr:hypothetical protein [Kofleriaceae bacterium]